MDRSTDTTAHDHSDRIARTAWFCAFVLPLTLAVLLLGVKSAQAASPASEPTPSALEEEFEGEEEFGSEDEAEFAEAECEIAEEEAAEGEITPAEAKAICKEAEEAVAEAKAGPSSTTPARCALRSAHAHAVLRHNRLKLTIGYTSSSPTPATIEVRSGARRIATVHRRLGRSGVLRITKTVGSKRMKRVTVSFKTPTCGTLQAKSTKVR
ncbi:MAG TPA: hypothetical protein VFG58_01060 [Solirubrobacterales bacterium]|nr:hypothetical protein [Solirubrobacterales bacterium]